MSTHQFLRRPEHDFEDRTFAPRSSFGFDDAETDLSHNMAAFQAFPGEGLDFDLAGSMYDEEGDFEQELFGGRSNPMAGANPFSQNVKMANNGQTNAFSRTQSQVNQSTGARPSVAQSHSVQRDIVTSRSKNVSEQFGQITPPHDDSTNPFEPPPYKQQQHQLQQSHGQENGKLSNEQRARNAANARHSRTKNAKKKRDPNPGKSDDAGNPNHSKNITLQREKNRVAAAKCRAKKKAANEQQEEMANENSATNDFLTRKFRELKNQKTELQNFLLAHRPGVCGCHGIHDYNFGQAQRLVLDARRHAMEPISSTSRDTAFSTQSPGSEASTGDMFAAHNRVTPQEMSNMPQRYPGLSGPTSYPMPHGVSADALQRGRDGSHISQEFAEFLQSSPGARAGFS